MVLKGKSYCRACKVFRDEDKKIILEKIVSTSRYMLEGGMEGGLKGDARGKEEQMSCLCRWLFLKTVHGCVYLMLLVV